VSWASLTTTRLKPTKTELRWRESHHLADFATGPQTRLTAIKVMLVPANPLIKGTFWLDDVKLTPVVPVEVDRQPSPNSRLTSENGVNKSRLQYKQYRGVSVWRAI
jgi:hypothetical protein